MAQRNASYGSLLDIYKEIYYDNSIMVIIFRRIYLALDQSVRAADSGNDRGMAPSAAGIRGVRSGFLRGE